MNGMTEEKEDECERKNSERYSYRLHNESLMGTSTMRTGPLVSTRSTVRSTAHNFFVTSVLQRPGKLLFSRAQYRAVLAPGLRNWARLARDG
jgi:hypothetical protein